MTQETEEENKHNIANPIDSLANDKRNDGEENNDANVPSNTDESDVDVQNNTDASEVDEDGDNGDETDDKSISDESFASEDEENGSPNERKVTGSGALAPEYNEPPSPPGEKCPICLNSLCLGQDIGTPDSCQGIHHFCLDCIEEWSANVNTCPVDRKEFTLVLVQREISGPVIEKISVKSRSVVLTFDDGSDRLAAPEEDDFTYCEICGRCDHEDRLLLCDGCDFGYHCDCLDPPILEIPIEEWFCPDCITRLFGSPSDGQTTFDQELNRLRRSRRNGSGRVIARTRASEVVRNRIIARRTHIDHLEDVITHVATNLSVPVASSSSTRRSTVGPARSTYRRRKRRTTKRSKGATKGTTRRKGRRKGRSVSRKGRSRKAIASNRALPAPVSVRERLSAKLGLTRKKSYGPHSLPLMNKSCPAKSVSDQREFAGIPNLSIMGHGLSSYGSVPIFRGDDDEENVSYNSAAVASVGSGGTSVLSNARVNITSNILSMKSVSATETSDLLGSILAGQEILHAESSRVMIARDGTLKLNSSSSSRAVKKRGCASDAGDAEKSDGKSSSTNVNSTNVNNDNSNNDNVNGTSNGSSKFSSGGKDSSSSSPSRVSPINRPEDLTIIKPTPMSSSAPGSIPLKKRKIEHPLEGAAQVKPEVTESPVEADIFSDIEPMTDDSLNVQSPTVKDNKNASLDVDESSIKTEKKEEKASSSSDDPSAPVSVASQDIVKIKSEPEGESEPPANSQEKETKEKDDAKVVETEKESKEVRIKKCKHGKIHTRSSRDKSNSGKSANQPSTNKDELQDSTTSEGREESDERKNRLKTDNVKTESDSSNLRGGSIFDIPSVDKSTDSWKDRSSDSSKKRSSYRESKDERERTSGQTHRDASSTSSRSNYSSSSSSYNRFHHTDVDRKYSAAADHANDSKDHRAKSYKDSKGTSESTATYSRDKHSARRLSRDESDYRRESKDESDGKAKRKFSSSSGGYPAEDRDRRRKESERVYPHSLAHRNYDRFDETLRSSDADRRKKYDASQVKRNQGKSGVKSNDGSDDERTSQPTPTQDEGSSPSYNSHSHPSNFSSSRGNLTKITKESLDGIRDWITGSGKNASSRSNEHSKVKNDSSHDGNQSAASSLFDKLKASVGHQRSSDGNSNDFRQLLQAVQSGLVTTGDSGKQKEIIKSKSQTPQYSDNSSDSDGAGSMPYSPSEDYDAYSKTVSGSGESLSSSAEFKAAVDQILSSAQQQQQQQASSSLTSNVFKKPRPPESHSKHRHKQMISSDSDALTSARELEIKEKYIQKLNRQERVVEEVKVVLKPFYQAREIDKSQYKEIMRKAVPKICHDKTGQIIPVKIKALVEKYVDQAKHQTKKSHKSQKPQPPNTNS